MADLLERLTKAPLTGPLLRSMGIPEPPDLTREEGAYGSKPLASKRVLASGSSQPLEALGANRTDAEGDVDVVVYDATRARDPGDLDSLYAFFHEYGDELAPCAKVLLLAPDPEALEEATALATVQAIDGFTRSLAKELGRQGATANLLHVPPEATDRLQAPMRYLSTPRSAYVSGQALHLDGRVEPALDPPGPRLEGKRAVVTGAAGGLGEVTARRLAAEGAQVIGVDLPSVGDRLEAVTDEIDGEPVAVDVTSEDAASVLGTPDVLVHNAGVTRDKILRKMPREMWDTVLEVNLRAILRLDEALLPRMPEGGRAIYMSSVAGIAGNPGQTNYAASKAGLIGHVRARAPDLASRGITANAVAPGFIRTAMTEEMPAMRRAVAARMNALLQAGEPRDAAEAVAFLADPDADGVTGQTLRVCGLSTLGR